MPTSPGPALAPAEQVGPRQTFQKPAENSAIEPTPANGSTPSGTAPSTGSDPSATYFEAPKLFNPNDRTASRVAAPVRNALYEKPVSYRPASFTGHITAAQVQEDAAGWTSASK
jgi:hypothetical protein